MDKSTQVVVGEDKATMGAILGIEVTLGNQAKVEKHQSFSMVSNLTPIDFQVCAAEISRYKKT